MTATPAANAAVRECVRAALRCEDGNPATYQLPPGLSVEDFLSGVVRHRVTELLATQGSALGLPQPAVEALLETRDAARLRTMLQVHELGRIKSILAGAGIDFLAFKGPSLSAQSTGDFTARGFGDLDILVPPEQVPATYAALLSAGWALRGNFPTPGPSYAWRHLMGDYELPLLGPSSQVDLHWRLHPTKRSLPPFETLWRRRVYVQIGDVHVATLSIADAFAHSCAHAAKDDWRWLRSLVDIHRLAGRPDIWEQVTLARGSVQLRSLAVTRDAIGLPANTPGEVLAQLDRLAPRRLRAAQRSQLAPVPSIGFPGLDLVPAIVRQSRGNRSPADLAGLVFRVLVSSTSLADVPDTNPVPAIAKASRVRAGNARRRLSTSMRRRG